MQICGRQALTPKMSAGGKRAWRKVAALGAAAAMLAAGSAAAYAQPVPPAPASAMPAQANAQAVPTPPEGSLLYRHEDPFYLPPAQLPSNPGEVVRSTESTNLLRELGVPEAGRVQTMLYTSTREDGKPVAVSGFVMEPSAPWLGAGPVPTVVFAPGTRGAGDACAPSRAWMKLLDVAPEQQAVNLNYELPFYQAASALGMRVVVTDLIGLGTPGAHTYANTLEEGHATLDAARAGLVLLGAEPTDPVGFYGYSQGGGAVAAAAELAQSYAPELRIAGTFAGAPPANLSEVLEGIDGSTIAATMAYTLVGHMDRNPGLQERVGGYLNDKGKRFLRDNAHGCIGDGALRSAFTESRQLTKTGESLGQIVARDPELKAIVQRQLLGTRALNAPMMIASAIHDDTVPSPQAKDLARAYCLQGGQVWWVPDELPAVMPKSVLNHAATMFSIAGPAMHYLLDRFNNLPVPSSCGDL